MKYKTLCINKILKFTTMDADKKIDSVSLYLSNYNLNTNLEVELV